jgi:7-cyano-7-deazaguanine synthase
MSSAVVLLSGGLDSCVTLAIAKQDNDEVYALTFDYGQRHEKEVESAKRLAGFYGVKKHMILRIPLEEVAESALTREEEPLPEHGTVEEMTLTIPPTYVPGRNIVLLSYALSWAESVHADYIYIGAHTQDYSGYPDCRPEFLKAFQNMANLGTRRGAEGRQIELRYPIINMAKSEIISKGRDLEVPFELTWSCYEGGEKACGKCDSCVFRLKGFDEVGLKDPLEYET